MIVLDWLAGIRSFKTGFKIRPIDIAVLGPFEILFCQK